MAYADQVTVASDPGFRSRVQIALVTAARNVVQQPPGPGDFGPSWTALRQLAVSVLRDPASLVDMASWALASIPTITTATSDADLQAAVNTLLRAIADIG